MPIDDASLIRKTLAGDRSAYGILMHRHQTRLFNTVFRLVGHSEDTRDVVQEAFINAYEALERFHGEAQFFTWLYRIAINAAISHKRRQRPTVRLGQGTDQQNSVREPSDESFDHRPGAAMERQEDAAMLQAALCELAPEFRAVLVLREIDGRKYEEIAEMLSVPIGTVRSRIHRGRLELRSVLESMTAEKAGQGHG